MRLHESLMTLSLCLILAPLSRAHSLPPANVEPAVAVEPQKPLPAPTGQPAEPKDGVPAEGNGDGGMIRPAIRPRPSPESEAGPRFQWGPALKQSGFFLGIMHAWRLATEPGTRAELRGPFLRDYVSAIKGVHGWGDGDPFIVNYVGHPFQGAVSGYIQVHNDPRYRRLEFSNSRPYWTSRLRAMAFAAISSTQFELGPVSEASLGNVGKNRIGAGAVDLVVTPLGGLGVMLAEDVLDRLLVRRIERWTVNPLLRALARGALNPNRAFANLMRFRTLWHRDSRPGVLEP